MSLWRKALTKIDQGLEYAQLFATAVEVIGDLAEHRPQNALDLIAKVVQGVKDAVTDKRSIAELHEELVKLRDSLSAQDATADAAGAAVLDQRFPKKDDRD